MTECKWPTKPLEQVQVTVNEVSMMATPERAYFDAVTVNEVVKTERELRIHLHTDITELRAVRDDLAKRLSESWKRAERNQEDADLLNWLITERQGWFSRFAPNPLFGMSFKEVLLAEYKRWRDK
jgi:hypothetical protein